MLIKKRFYLFTTIFFILISSNVAYASGQNNLELIIITKGTNKISYEAFREKGYVEEVKDWYVSKGGKEISDLDLAEITNQKDKYIEINKSLAGKRLVNIIGGSLVLVGGGMFWFINDQAVRGVSVGLVLTGVTLGFIGDLFSCLPSVHHLSFEETVSLVNAYNMNLKKESNIEQLK